MFFRGEGEEGRENDWHGHVTHNTAGCRVSSSSSSPSLFFSLLLLLAFYKLHCRLVTSTGSPSAVSMMQFNQDCTCLSVIGPNSFAIYNCDPFDVCYTSSQYGKVSIIEMLFSTSLVTIVLDNEQRNHLRILNIRKDNCICELSFPSKIQSVKLNRKRLVIVLVDQIQIYDVISMKLIHTIKTDQNIKSFSIPCALSSSNKSILVYQQGNTINDLPSNPDNRLSPLNINIGNAVVFDTINLKQVAILDCHKSILETIALSENGILLATSSTKGTIIRIFNTKTSVKLLEFRRGSLNAKICSLSFNNDNTILACSSDNGTVHFFKIPNEVASLGITPSSHPNSNFSNNSSSNDTSDNTIHSDNSNTNNTTPNNDNTDYKQKMLSMHELPKRINTDPEEDEEISQLFNSLENGTLPEKSKKKSKAKQLRRITGLLWNQSKYYIPDQINSIIDPVRDFASIKLDIPCSSVVAMSDNICYIATSNGDFYQYQIQYSASVTPEESSNHCKLIKQNLIPSLL